MAALVSDAFGGPLAGDRWLGFYGIHVRQLTLPQEGELGPDDTPVDQLREVDFLIFDRQRGFAVLEVKGGLLRMVKGEWQRYGRPDDVYDALQSLWKAIQTWRDSPEGAIGTTVKELLRQSGYDEKRCSTAAIGKNPAEYSMVFRGRSITIEQHMTLGSGNPNTCLSIHWWRDESTRELVVGHCGRHLSNSLT